MREAKVFLGVKDESNAFLQKPVKTFINPERNRVKNSRTVSVIWYREASHHKAQPFKVTNVVIFNNEIKTEIPATAFPYLRVGDLK